MLTSVFSPVRLSSDDIMIGPAGNVWKFLDGFLNPAEKSAEPKIPGEEFWKAALVASGKCLVKPVADPLNNISISACRAVCGTWAVCAKRASDCAAITNNAKRRSIKPPVCSHGIPQFDTAQVTR